MLKALKPEFKDKAIRSFVIRGGRMTDAQRAAFDHYWPQYGLSLYDGRMHPAQVFAQDQPLAVEVGFGMGDSLLQMARDEPYLNFIGIEVHPPGVGRLINNAGKLGLDNLKVYMADAKDVLDECFDDDSISRLQVYFPDPWHKKKHHKRRIVQADFTELAVRKLKAEALLHIATDWQTYAEAMLEVLQAHPRLQNTAADFSPRPAFRPQTKFEQRGAQLGHGVWDLLFKKLAFEAF